MQQRCLRSDISNHYLKTRKYPQEQASFEKDIDPKGILAVACTRRNLFDTEDNKVKLFSSSINQGERKRVECKQLTARIPTEALTQSLQIPE